MFVYIERYAFYRLEPIKTKLTRHEKAIHFVKDKVCVYLKCKLNTSYSQLERIEFV